MLPVLFTIGSVPISSFGFFLAIGFLASVFSIWRIAQAYEIDQEKILDLTLLTFLGGLIMARLYFVALNWELFGSFSKILLINRYPGLSFWGGFLGGFLTLWYFCKRMKLHFWQIADFAAVAFLLGLTISDVGCFLGGCAYGTISTLPVATTVVGLVGKRFPTPLIESILLVFVYLHLRKAVLKFHFPGKILSVLMIVLGIIKFLLEFLRGDANLILAWVSYGHVLSFLCFFIGVSIYYSFSKRQILADLNFFLTLPFKSRSRSQLGQLISRNWKNFQVDSKINSGRFLSRLSGNISKLKRKLNVKPTPTNPQ